MIVLKFRGEELELEFSNYRNNDRVYMGLTVIDSGEPYMDCTVNVPSIRLREGEIIIKDYSENEGVHAMLLREGIVGPKLYPARSGHVELTVCKLLLKKDTDGSYFREEKNKDSSKAMG